MERIKAILKEYDLGASIVLHTPGFSEFLLKVDPSYSCVKTNGDEIRIKTRLQEDYNGDKKLRDKAIEDSVNMIGHFGDVNGKTALMFFELMDRIKKEIDVEETGGNMSSHTTQNN